MIVQNFLKIVVIPVFLTVLVGCGLDGFMFNEKQINQYELPDNNIPDSLISEIQLDSEGYAIYGFLVQSVTPNDITILYCHGNKHNIDEYWQRVMWLHQLNVNVLVFDYRGFGKSAGEASEHGMLKDAEAALAYLISKGLGDSICLYGYSLGNVASIHLAANRINPLILIAEAPFASANSLTQGSSIFDIPPGWLTDAKFDNIENIKKINTPLLLLHGTDDDFVRFRDNGRLVYEHAPVVKKLVLIDSANHDDIQEVMGVESYLKEISDWIDSQS